MWMPFLKTRSKKDFYVHYIRLLIVAVMNMCLMNHDLCIPSIMLPTSSMNSATNSFSFLIILLPSALLMVLSPLCSAQPLGDIYRCNNDHNYTSGSAFAANLNTLLSNIASVPPLINSRGHFFNLTVGTKPGDDFVSGMCLCRGDLSPTDCRSSCMDTARSIRQVCPNQKQAFRIHRECIFRYSDQPIIGIMASSPWFCYANQGNSSDPKAFHRQLVALLRSLQAKAVYGARWSAGRRRVSGSQQVYADSGCNLDLNASSCLRCFHDLIKYIPSCCYGKIGGAILSPSCDFRFETYQFYHLSDDSLPSPSDSPSANISKGKKTKSTQIFVSTAVSTFVALLLIGIWIFHRRRKAIQTNITDEVEDAQNIMVTDCVQFNLATIKEATCDFSFNNKLGEGGFGEVYKGKLESGQDVAVKRLSKNSYQGMVEFETEIILVAKLQHKNLVKLLGFCMAPEEKILVYEFLSNSSLDRILFDPKRKASLDWTTRFKIILGIARGLLYLHEDSRLKVIHRDLTASNILLDDLMNPKISDFGLAKLFGMDQTQADTKRIVGTYGYMAPEYAITGHFSTKSDVFSFGVIVLEIVAARKNRHTQSNIREALLHRAWRLWTEKKILDMVDPDLQNNYQVEEVTKCVHIGLLCIQEDPIQRPTMSTVVRALTGDTSNLPTPNSPHLFYRSVDIGEEKPSSSSHTIAESITGIYPR